MNVQNHPTAARTWEFPVEGMSCGGCVRKVEQALAGVPGVTRAEANLTTGRASVDLVPGGDPAGLDAALSRSGFAAGHVELQFAIDDMHCGSCIARVEEAATDVPGVISASANLASGTLNVTALDGSQPERAIISALSRIGYAATLGTTEVATDKVPEVTVAARRAAIAALLCLPVFVTEMGGHVFPEFHHWLMANFGQRTIWWVQFALTTVLMAGPGRVFYLRGIPSLLRGAPDMNALVALGTLAAWGYSVAVLLAPGLFPETARFVYFEAAAVIVTLILTGRWLEARAKGQTGAAIRSLMALQPETARLQGGRDVPVAQLVEGDLILARPGEGFAVDGIVTSGEGFVDEAMITGEATPVSKASGDAVTGGTLNGNSAITYRATATGDATVLAQIIRMVAQAQAARLPVQNLVNKIAAWFVPIVLVVAALTVAIWVMFGPSPALTNALIAGVSVLIIACPCAMGLAIPTSIVVGTGRAAQMGVLFRQGSALQRLGEVGAVAFDKTGTLTEGSPVLVDFHTTGMDSDQALTLIAGAEAASEHPVAHAIIEAAREKGLEPSILSSAEAVPGQGVVAQVEGGILRVGTTEMMQSNGISPAAFEGESRSLANAGRAPIYAALNGEVFAAFAVADTLRSEAKGVVDRLRNLGIESVMLTGDAEEVADSIADALGIKERHARLRPEGKSAALEDLRARLGPVAFVGDGINDAPALASADVGIAIGSGANVAIEAADVILRSGDLRGVEAAILVSRHTMRNIRQNLVWAFGYNVALIPVAAGALTLFGGPMLSPMLAAGAMAASSVLVIANALRLRWIGGREWP